MQILFLIFMFVIGAIFGSFLCCQVRRLHRRVTRMEGAPHGACDVGEENARQDPSGQYPKRSICLHCKKQLKWYDNIPIVSWMILRGKCRNCHKKIGLAEIISELTLAFTFLAFGTYFLCLNSPIYADLLSDFPSIAPMSWAIFIVTLLFTLSLAFLAIYDGLYGELPNIGFIISGILAIVLTILSAWPDFTPMPIASAGIYGGIYLFLYLISKGKWVGDGDWILAAIIGLALGHPWLSMIALLVANLAACIIMYPIVKKSKNHKIYFGPFLVISFVITYMFSDFIMSMI